MSYDSRVDFIEIEFQCAVMAAYFSLFKSRSDLRLYIPSLHMEKKQGADWIFENTKGVPFYFQFKRSQRPSDSILTERKHKLNIDDNKKEVFGFKLHKSGSDFIQHNILYKKDKENYSFYVAPLFISRERLNLYLRKWLSGEEFLSEYYYKLFEGIGRDFHKERFKFDDMPFLNNVIYIKPHSKIDSGEYQHSYAFNNDYKVSFHSEPKELSNEHANTIDNIIPDAIETLKKGFKGDKKSKTLNDVRNELIESVDDYINVNFQKEIRKAKLSKLERISLGIDTVDDQSFLKRKPLETIDNLIETLKEAKKENNFEALNITNALFENLFGINILFVYEYPF